jgi:predicted transposase/invertase (TIGR01784 family)
LIEGHELLGEYTLHFKYFPIIENSYNRQMLLQLGNIVSTLFLLEAHYEANLLQRAHMALFEKSQDKQAVSLFLNFVLRLYLHGRIDESDYKKLERVYQDRQEVSMLIEAIQKEKTQLRESGKKEGRLEVARMMLRSGEPIEKIKRYTGLSDVTIRKLQQKLQEQ